MHDQNQFDGEWIDGNVVGVCHRSSEYLVISGDKILKGPTIRRRMASEAYKKECLDEVKADFYKFIRRGATTSRAETMGGGAELKDPDEGKEKVHLPRRAMIRMEDLETMDILEDALDACGALTRSEFTAGTRENAETGLKKQ